MRKGLPWVMVAAAWAFAASVYGRLPAEVAVHFDVHGDPNGWGNRAFAAFVTPALMTLLAFMLPRMPLLDPRRANYEKFQGTYDLVIDAVIAMLLVIHVAMLGVAIGWPVRMERLGPVAVGLLFVVIGNVMPRARPNWWFGIRTPWTMSSDRVWERTHRVGGQLFVAGGLLLMVLAAIPPTLALPLIVGVVIAAVVIPLVYSYFIWKKETSK